MGSSWVRPSGEGHALSYRIGAKEGKGDVRTRCNGCPWEGGRPWGAGSVRTKNGAKAVGRLPPKEATFLNRPRPSCCPQRRVFTGTQRFPGEPTGDRWEYMDHFERKVSDTSLHPTLLLSLL